MNFDLAVCYDEPCYFVQCSVVLFCNILCIVLRCAVLCSVGNWCSVIFVALCCDELCIIALSWAVLCCGHYCGEWFYLLHLPIQCTFTPFLSLLSVPVKPCYWPGVIMCRDVMCCVVLKVLVQSLSNTEVKANDTFAEKQEQQHESQCSARGASSSSGSMLWYQPMKQRQFSRYTSSCQNDCICWLASSLICMYSDGIIAVLGVVLIWYV